MLTLLTLLSSSFAADCPELLTRADLAGRLDRAVSAYRELDSDGFFVHMASAQSDLPCMSTQLRPEDVAALHRLIGVTEFSRNGTLSALPSFYAANRIEPSGSLPVDLVPEGHELWQLADQVGRGNTERLAPPHRRIQLLIDGFETRDRPLGEPVVVQILTDDQLTSTTYVAPDEPIPEYRLSKAPATRRAVVGTTAGLFAAAAIGTYAVALNQGAPIRSGDVPDTWTRDDVLARQQQVNTLTGVALTSGLLSVALGTTALAL